MTWRDKQRKHDQRRAHATRRDNRRPAGSELLSTIRARHRAARAKAATRRG